MPLELVSGTIRDDKAVIACHCADLNAQQLTITLFLSPLGRVVHNITWPSDFEITTEENGFRGVFCLPDIARNGIIKKIDLLGPGGKISDQDGWSLINLFAENTKEFEDKFFRIKKRVKDPETLCFTMCQIMDAYHCDEGNRCVAAVIYGYKSLDLLNQKYMADAISHLERQIQRTSDLPITLVPRTDRDHLGISMRTVLWHLLLATKEYDRSITILEEAVHFAATIKNPEPILCYNLCRLILTRVYLFAKIADIESTRRMATLNFDFFTKSYVNIKMDTIWFKEMKEAHEAVLLSLFSLDEVRKGKKTIDSAIIFEAVNRIRTPSSSAFLFDKYVDMLKWYRKLNNH